ncbi:YdcF family protein [Massilia sp. TWR1-2-2]|uniref:YdcF family protein n=1 Tax=Massilia sp. TWR1-2-2 TaxID=2804584 RepID=UPI003CEB8E34
MSSDELQRIAAYIMPSLPACASDLGFLFGTRHGVPEFCTVAQRLWQKGIFNRLLISGGRTGSMPLAEADMIAERLVGLGVPETAFILATAATNTGANVRFGRARVAEVMDLAAIRSVVVIGKMCSTRRYLMTMQRHWPGVRLSVCPVNYFGIPDELWHEHAEFRARVLSEYDKIRRYLAEGFLEEINGCPAYPPLAPRQSV